MRTGSVINLKFDRPDEKLVELFRDLPVANIDDALGRMSAVDQNIRPVNDVQLLGPAFTVKVAQGDNLYFHKALDLAKPGDVIVIDSMGSKDRAIFGELMASYCRQRGIAGIITDGPIRDIDDIASYDDMSVYSNGVVPNGPYKNGPGEIGTTISFGGQVVRPGDIIAGDKDGIVVIKPEEAEELAEKARAINEKETKIIETMKNEGTYERPWVDETLAKLGAETIE
ncbi:MULTISPECIES: RraA family protein [Anaerococcus]|jgi:putative demethylmenaquinone methyltransferase|uniref:Putative 4-hydroxy-4-methyl-2-oxoglutarate aldolase n=1 Tax=Anaerococcus octavius TaxID=54007 RepID=A0A380WVJ2_9FIRM|nr:MULTISPECIES: RraA family protein [Anaerococcus]MDU2598745.1 RraA family protein [Anaerococcus sp.]MDU3177136.1 RraA family protein [Anaerococcus sp.]MDU4025169.1 RraA family protein [Anaerococcus sp.]MDU5230479.1 RraA family protein [Anaerococcus sp.]MDU5534630.1 RraA family protein [Anaerococcus sp.]